MIVSDFVEIITISVLCGFGIGVGLSLIGLTINGIIGLFRHSV